jgi:hypothetical protein
VLKIRRKSKDRKAKLSDKMAKAVNDLSLGDFATLLEHLKPELEPDKFREHLDDPGKLPSGFLYQEHFETICNWCLKDSGAKTGGIIPAG